MEPQLRRRGTLDAIKRIILRESLKQPLIVMFEDLHWVDDETHALLKLLAESIGNARVLMLVNYRPEYSHQWGSKTYYTQLRLDPLGRESAEELLSALMSDAVEAEAAQAAHHGADEGNPFFIGRSSRRCSTRERWFATARSRSHVPCPRFISRPRSRESWPRASTGCQRRERATADAGGDGQGVPVGADQACDANGGR